MPKTVAITKSVGAGMNLRASTHLLSEAVPMPVKTGDHVVFPASAGVWIEVDEERLLVCRVGELLGVIEQVTDWEYSER